MNRKIKWTLLGLLGFATACATAKQPAKRSQPEPETDRPDPVIVAMYGVRLPSQVTPEATPGEEEKAALRARDSVVLQTPGELDENPGIVVMYGVETTVPLVEDGER